MEGGIVDTAIVTLQDVFHSGEIIECFKSAWARVGSVFTQPRDVPHTNRLVHGGRDDQIVLGVETGGHNIVGVAC